MSKAITPVVSIILLLLITISIVGFAMLFFQRTAQQAGEETQTQLQQQLAAGVERFEIVSIDKNKVYVKNAGTSALTSLKFYVDGSEVSAGAVSIPSGTVGEAALDSAQLAQLPGDRIKVTSAGSQDEVEAKFYAKNTAAYWRFDDGERAAIKDYSGNGNDGTFVGESWNDGTLSPACPNCPAQVTGKYGKALEFAGNDHYVSIDQNPNFAYDMASDFTISFWARKDSTDNDDGFFISKRSDSNNFWSIQSSNANEYISVQFCQSGSCGSLFVTPTGSFPHDTWNNAVIVHTQNTAKVYINGNLLVDGTKTTATSGNYGNSPIFIGKIANQEYFKGLIDEVRIYNRALTQQEIQEDMKSAYPVAGTVASYSFEKFTSDGKAQDTHNIVKGKYGAAMSFDGVDDRIDFGDTINPTTDFTVEFWMNAPTRQENPTGFYDPVSFGHGGTVGWVFQGSGSTMTWHAGDGTLEPIDIDIDVRDNAWHHFMASISSSAGRKLSRDGGINVRTGTKTQITHLPLQPFMLGTDPTILARAFNGTLDEVRILNVAR